MSGRSAHVRKEKTKIKDGQAVVPDTKSQSSHNADANDFSYNDFPAPVGHQLPYDNGSQAPTKKQSSARSIRSTEGDDMAYARVKKPVVPNLDISGIEKSSTREKMDKMSENARKALSGMSFGRKKKKNHDEQDSARPPTSATVRPPNDNHQQDEPTFNPAPVLRNRTNTLREIQEEPPRSGPPYGKLPALPPPPQIKRWLGNGRQPQNWNKLRKDPELWDPHGDTLIFLGHEAHRAARPPPSFRVSSHVLEQTESRFFINLLRDGYVDDTRDSDIPQSPVSSSDRMGNGGRRLPSRQGAHPTPPQSDTASNHQDPDGEISYELYFPPPMNLSKVDSLRHHLTTRNVFALLYQASLVGLTMSQALNDLHERLQMYMPPDTDNAGLVIDYIVSKGLDDVRNDATAAISLLAWSENKFVRWQEGWREAFVHCAGMQERLDSLSELKIISPITKALLERASLDSQVRIQDAEDRLANFNFGDMFPAMSDTPPPERASFERLRKFFKGFYEAHMGGWPVQSNTEQWLSRDVIRVLQTDFGALYEYLVDREVRWDGTEERSSRKWAIVRDNSTNFNADTEELPMTDILVAFDNRHRYPHIPHPYSLVPESMSPAAPKEQKLSSKKSNQVLGITPAEDRIAERKAALAYTEATNIYILSDFAPNRLVDAFVKFEKTDQPGQVDPFAARRGRWVLIYGILQTLASVSVDVPGLRWKEGVQYHLNPRLRGTLPWKGADANIVEASHERSYCWLAPQSWTLDLAEMPALEPPSRRRDGNGFNHTPLSIRSSLATVSTESDAGGSVKSPASLHARTARRFKGQVREHEREKDGFVGLGNFGFSGYGPGIERVEEWPIREESRASRRKEEPLMEIKDFDEYEF